MNKAQINGEVNYLTSMHIANNMLNQGIIDKKDFNKMKSFFLEKYEPIISSLAD